MQTTTTTTVFPCHLSLYKHWIFSQVYFRWKSIKTKRRKSSRVRLRWPRRPWSAPSGEPYRSRRGSGRTRHTGPWFSSRTPWCSRSQCCVTRVESGWNYAHGTRWSSPTSTMVIPYSFIPNRIFSVTIFLSQVLLFHLIFWGQNIFIWLCQILCFKKYICQLLTQIYFWHTITFS